MTVRTCLEYQIPRGLFSIWCILQVPWQLVPSPGVSRMLPHTRSVCLAAKWQFGQFGCRLEVCVCWWRGNCSKSHNRLGYNHPSLSERSNSLCLLVPKSFSWHLLESSVRKTTLPYLFGVDVWVQKLLEKIRRWKAGSCSCRGRSKGQYVQIVNMRVFGFVG